MKKINKWVVVIVLPLLAIYFLWLFGWFLPSEMEPRGESAVVIETSLPSPQAVAKEEVSVSATSTSTNDDASPPQVVTIVTNNTFEAGFTNFKVK